MEFSFQKQAFHHLVGGSNVSSFVLDNIYLFIVHFFSVITYMIQKRSQVLSYGVHILKKMSFE
jgi:hypothetical protein